MMEQRLQYLLQRLAFLGYQPYEINHIVKSAPSRVGLIGQLERYEKLGLHYLHNYSQ